MLLCRKFRKGAEEEEGGFQEVRCRSRERAGEGGSISGPFGCRDDGD